MRWCYFNAPVEREEIRNQLKKAEDKKAGCSYYCRYTKTDRAEIWRYAANHDASNGVWKFNQRCLAIKQRKLSYFERTYLEMKSIDPSELVTEIEAKKHSCLSSRWIYDQSSWYY